MVSQMIHFENDLFGEAFYHDKSCNVLMWIISDLERRSEEVIAVNAVSGELIWQTRKVFAEWGGR